MKKNQSFILHLESSISTLLAREITQSWSDLCSKTGSGGFSTIRKKWINATSVGHKSKGLTSWRLSPASTQTWNLVSRIKIHLINRTQISWKRLSNNLPRKEEWQVSIYKHPIKFNQLIIQNLRQSLARDC